MREIKFRAWDGNKMRGIYKNDYFSIRNDGLPSQNVPVKLMQYTGLKDSEGVEIYEGDVLKHNGIVAWNEEEYRWSCIDLNWNDRREIHDLDYLTSEFIVIGNIYEDSHLLES